MKKILVAFVIFLSVSVTLKAECTYSDIVELNTLASHVNYSYEYDSLAQEFKVTFNNVTNQLKLENFNTTFEPVNNKVVISGFEGQTLIVEIYVSKNSKCPNKLLRTINISLPYENNYYRSSYCAGYMYLPICNTRFLSYDINFETFQGILNKQKNIDKPKEEPKENEIIEDSLIDKIIEEVTKFIKKYWLESSLIIGSSLITFLIGNAIYKKIKYKF